MQDTQGFKYKDVATSKKRKGACSRTRPVHRKSELEGIICKYNNVSHLGGRCKGMKYSSPAQATE